MTQGELNYLQILETTHDKAKQEQMKWKGINGGNENPMWEW